MIKSIPCPICLNISFEPLIDFSLVPRSGTYLSNQEQKPKMIHLSFEFCSYCALIRRRVFNDETYSYTYNNRVTTHQLPSYADLILDSLYQYRDLSDDLIIDCGTNDGTFLNNLRKAGFSNLLGIEPSIYCAEKCRSKGHNVVNRHLDYAESQHICKQFGQARIIICRHVLEHVQNPFDFLLAIRTLLKKDGVLFIEVPNAHTITQDLFGHELWDEHLHIFTPENLSLLMQRAGFQVAQSLVKTHLNTSNILQWCNSKAVNNVPKTTSKAMYSDVKLCRCFADRWKSLCRQILDDLPNWPRPIVSFGASHPQSNFLLFTGLGHQIDFIVDDDEAKIGLYLPVPNNVPIVSSIQFLENIYPGTVVRTAFGYDDWMDNLVAPLIYAGVQIFTPYD